MPVEQLPFEEHDFSPTLTVEELIDLAEAGMLPGVGDALSTGVPPKDLQPIPPESFEEFYHRFKTVAEMVQHPLWASCYCHFFHLDPQELHIRIDETDEEVAAYTFDEQVDELGRCAASFGYWCHKYARILNIEAGRIIRFKLYRYQKKTIAVYESHRFSIMSKFRQGGLTTVSTLYGLWLCLFSESQKIMVLSKTDREAVAAGEIVTNALGLLPSWMKPEMKVENAHEKSFSDTSSSIWFYTPKAARGRSLSWLFIDEGAFIEGMHTHWAAMYPTVSTGGRVGVISTVNGLGNWYEETYHDALNGQNAFQVIEMDFWEHPGYVRPTWEVETRANLGPKKWAQEVLRSFLGSGNTFIPVKILAPLDRAAKDAVLTRAMFAEWTNESQDRAAQQEAVQIANAQGLDVEAALNDAGGTGAMWVWKTPAEGREYIIGADVAAGMGEGSDNSCFQVLDRATLEQVAEFYSNLIPPHLFAQVLHQVGHWYNDALLVVEDKEEGHTVLSKLAHDLGYDNLWAEVERQDKPGVATSGKSRGIMMELLQTALLNQAMALRSTRLIDELKTFSYDNRHRKPRAESGRHDDAIMALCMGLYAMDRESKGMPVGADGESKKLSITADKIESIRKEIESAQDEDFMDDSFGDSYFGQSFDRRAPAVFDLFNMPDVEDHAEANQSFGNRDKAGLLKEFGF